MAVILPKFVSLVVENYSLFPSEDGSEKIEIDFSKEFSLIVGINGLGKTTILHMLLRMLTGPYDLTGYGEPNSYDAILKKNPSKLNNLKFFAQRVADGAKESKAILKFKLGRNEVLIERNLSSYWVEKLKINGDIILSKANSKSALSREKSYQDEIANLFNLGSFVNVILVLHNIVFF